LPYNSSFQNYKNSTLPNNSVNFYKNYTITSSDTLVVDKEKIILSNGDAIYANANATTSITTTVGYIAL
jgi:hypothetical protein